MISCFLLAVLLTMTLGIDYLVNGHRVLSPCFLSTTTFLISIIIYFIEYKNINTPLSFLTIMVIWGSMTGLLIGEILGKKICFKWKSNRFADIDSEKLEISAIKVYLISGFILLIGMIRFFDLVSYARQIGYTGNPLLAVSVVRHHLVFGEYKISLPLQIVTTMCEASTYLFLYYFLYHWLITKKMRLKLLWPIIFYSLILIASTGRTSMIRTVCVFAIILFFLMQKQDIRKKRVNLKILKYGFITLGVIAIWFWGYGKFARGSNKTFAGYLTGYVAAALYGLNLYLQDRWIPNDMFGQRTLSNFYYYLNKVGFHFSIPEYHLPFFKCGDIDSNIYTGLLFSIQDYGIAGLFISRIFIGFLYMKLTLSIFKKKQLNRKKDVVFIVLTAYAYYPILILPIADRFIDMLTVVSFPMLVFFIYIINYFLVKK